MPLNFIVGDAPEGTYKKFLEVYSELGKSKKSAIFYFEGTGSNGTWCNWCKVASSHFDKFVKNNKNLAIWKVGVGNKDEWGKTENGKRTSPFYVNFPYILAVPTLMIVTIYHGVLRIAARISIPEDPSSLDWDRFISSYLTI